MINNRTLIILAVVVLALGAVSFWQKSAHQSRTSRSSASVLIDREIKGDDLDRITLGQGETEVVLDLVKTPEGWTLATSWDAPVSQDRIDGLLRTLSNLAGEYRSDDAGVLADYGLDDSTAVHIRGYQGGSQVFGLEAGNTSQGQPGNFVRLPDRNAVYLSRESVLSQLGIYGEVAAPKARHFLDLQAVKEDRNAVDRIVLRDGDQVIEMAKEFAPNPPAEGDTTGADPGVDRLTWEWKLVKPGTEMLAKTKADGVLGSLVNIRAADVDDPGGDLAAYGLDSPARSATLVLEDGTEMVLEFGAERPADGDKQAGTWMRIRGQDRIWVVTSYTTKNIFKSLEDLRPDQG